MVCTSLPALMTCDANCTTLEPSEAEAALPPLPNKVLPTWVTVVRLTRLRLIAGVCGPTTIGVNTAPSRSETTTATTFTCASAPLFDGDGGSGIDGSTRFCKPLLVSEPALS